jgi:EF hand
MKSIITLLSVLAMAATVSAADGAAKKGDAKGKGKADPAAAFAKMDKDGDGKVSKEEFMASPQAKKDATKAGESFTKRDKNSDGSLSKEEFMPAKKGKK